MKKLWNPTQGMTCSDLGNNLIAFQFKSLMEPWNFNKHVLVLKKEYDEGINEDDLPFGDYMRASPLKIPIVMAEKRGSNKGDLRKSLFSEKKKKKQIQKEEMTNGGTENQKESGIQVQVSDLLSSLENVFWWRK